MTPLVRRIVAERRWAIVPLAVLAAANLGVYLFVVRPLAASTAGAADRATRAAASAASAAREEAAARALVTGAERAADKLRAFYEDVLPTDRSTARRMTYVPLADLAVRHQVRYDRRSQDFVEADEDQRLTRLQMQMELEGPYERVRRFIFDVESGREFLIIDDIVLREAEDDRVQLAIGVSTYVREEAPAP
jgi:hypothetical protein